MAQLLISNGIDVDLKDNSGKTALNVAMDKGISTHFIVIFYSFGKAQVIQF